MSLNVSRFLLWCFFLITISVTGACAMVKPPLEFAPNSQIVTSGLILQLELTQTNLSQSLNVAKPELEVKQINVKNIEPFFLNQLPVYHLRGDYNLILKYPHHHLQQKQNHFDLYLQKQKEGKTWRLLRKQHRVWRSYLISS